MKKCLFTILGVCAYLGINISPSLSMEEGASKIPDSFWNSLPGNFMSLGGNLEKEIQAFERQSVDNGIIRVESKAELLVKCFVAKAPSLKPTIYDFCQFLEKTRNRGGNNENIDNFLRKMINESSFQEKIRRDIMENSYASVYLNYLSPYRGYK